MPTVSEILAFLDSKAPLSTKMEWDNVGLLAGFAGQEVKRILIALDITDEVVSEAAAIGAELIVSHHPLFFDLKSVTDKDGTGRKIVNLIKNGISAICLHTNLDAASGGVNDTMAALLGLSNVRLLSEEGKGPDGSAYGIGRYGELPEPVSMDSFLQLVKSKLVCNGLRYHDSGKPVRRVAVLGGSGGGDMKHAIEKGCDTFVTADIRYNTFLDAKEEGLNLIDADHFCTENVVCPRLKQWLGEAFTGIEVDISAIHKQTANFF